MGRGPSSNGIIRDFGGNRFQAEINWKGRRYRKVVDTKTAARQWITATFTSLEHEAPPLNQADMVAASAAKAELPEGVSLAAVVAFWMRHHAKDGKTVEDVVDVYMHDKQGSGLRASTLRTMRWQMGRLKDRLGAYPIMAVDRTHIERAFNELGAAGVGRDDTRRSWKGFWSWAIRAGMAEANPLAAISAYRRDDTPPAILTPKQATSILLAAMGARESCHRAMVPYLAIALFAGLRTSELEGLAWENIDMEAGHILVGSAIAKTRTRRYVTIHPSLRAWLLPYRRRGPLVEVGRRPRMIRLSRIAALAGVRIPQNAFRHSFASYHLAMWQDASKTAFELGHTRPDLLYRHYRNLVNKASSELYWNIDPSSIRQPAQDQELK